MINSLDFQNIQYIDTVQIKERFCNNSHVHFFSFITSATLVLNSETPLSWEEFEDIKGVITTICKSKDRQQLNGQKKKNKRI
jgi:hypothetical protein